MKKLSGLGRGLASLIPQGMRVKVVPRSHGEDTIYNVEVASIRPNSDQPRRDFDTVALNELASSIKKYGVLQPILVSKISTEHDRGVDVEYEIIAGERRWRAAKLAGLPRVPVIVKDAMDERQLKLEVALVENLQREDLNPMEEAEAYARLAAEFKLTQQDIASKVGKSREVIANAVRLVNLPGPIKEALRSGKIQRTHARALLAFKDEKQQMETFRTMLAGNSLTSRHLEASARSVHGPRATLASAPANGRFVELQHNLATNLGATVNIKPAGSGGLIEIRFTNLEELNKIAKTILD